MTKSKDTSIRVFKTAWFVKAARKAGIDDVDLCAAVREAMHGQAVDLGGGVFKKRLNDNMHRSIILSKAYAGLTDRQVAQLLQDKDLTEVCHDD